MKNGQTGESQIFTTRFDWLGLGKSFFVGKISVSVANGLEAAQFIVNENTYSPNGVVLV